MTMEYNHHGKLGKIDAFIIAGAGGTVLLLLLVDDIGGGFTD